LIRFELMVEHDLPIAVDEVLARTKAPALDYIGFSMGGMLLYASIGHSVAAEKIRRVAIIGSPAIIRAPLALPVPAIVGRLPPILFPTLRFRLAARAGAFASEWVKTPAHHWVFNPRNVAPGIARSALMNLIEDIPGPLNRDFAVWAATADGAITHGGINVLERLATIESPAIFFAGGADRLAPASAVRAAYDAWGAKTAHPRKRFVLLSVAEGASADYGHGDLAIGARVREEIFEPLAAFLDEDAAVQPEPGDQ
jgi:pimeloyl-ACP methyl ester carboxylesterase